MKKVVSDASAGTVLPDADVVVRRLGQRVIRVDGEMLSASLLAAFPCAVGRVDWRKVPGTVFRQAPPERSAGANNGPGTLDTRAYVAEVVRFFRECVSATGDAPDSWVIFIGDNLECDYKVQLSAVGELFEEVADVPQHKYVFPANCSWCFMWSFEDDLYFGLRPSRPLRRARQ
jgi:hypothetical protein